MRKHLAAALEARRVHYERIEPALAKLVADGHILADLFLVENSSVVFENDAATLHIKLAICSRLDDRTLTTLN